MTKQDSVENTLKCQLALEDKNMVDLSVGNFVEQDISTVCSHKVCPEHQPKLEVTHVARKPYSNKNEFARGVEKLYNLESGNEPEKSLDIKLDLYQMENH